MDSVIGLGVDLTQISRLRRILSEDGEHFESRFFNPVERMYCRSKSDPFPHFAARFAAKEAYGKALGLGLGPSGNFSDIYVTNDAAGVPQLVLEGDAQSIFKKRGGRKILLSLSHEGDMAIASVIIVGEYASSN